MAIPDYQSLMLPLLQAATTEEQRGLDVIEKLADRLGLTEEERTALLPSGKMTVFYDRVHWAKSYLTKAGLLETTRRGYFRITERGKQVLATSPTRIDNRFLSQFPEFTFVRARAGGTASEETPSLEAVDTDFEKLTPDELIRKAYGRLETELADNLLQRIVEAPPAFFESVVVQLLLAMGYGGTRADAGRALGRSGDGGVDGVIDEDALGLDRVYVQAKRYADGTTVGPAAVQAFFGALDNFKAAKGLFVTTSSFTKGAVDTAERFSKRIVLIDGQKLTRLMIRHGVGCRVEETLKIMKIDEDFFE